VCTAACNVVFHQASAGRQCRCLSYALQLLSFADMDGEETFDASSLGSAEEVAEEKVSDDTVLLLKGMKTTKAVSTALFWKWTNSTCYLVLTSGCCFCLC